MCVHVCVYVRACVCACVRACVYMCVHACVMCAHVCYKNTVHIMTYHTLQFKMSGNCVGQGEGYVLPSS